MKVLCGWTGLISGIAAHAGDSSHKYKAEYNPPDDTFPAKRMNLEVLIPKGNYFISPTRKWPFSLILCNGRAIHLRGKKVMSQAIIIQLNLLNRNNWIGERVLLFFFENVYLFCDKEQMSLT